MMTEESSTEDDDKYPGFKPRSYQIEMYEMAKEANLIVKLNTGAGKTFIAVMLIKYYLWRTDESLENGGKRIVFLVKNVHLVRQQASAIRQHLPFDSSAVGEYCGQVKPGDWVDFWTKDTWLKVFNSHRIIVITAGVFKDILNHAKFTLDHTCLLIFDECHHTSKDDDYVQICRHLIPYILARSKQQSSTKFQSVVDEEEDNGPRVLGLTACVVNGNVRPSQIAANVIDLEWSMGCQLVTSCDPQSLSFARDTVERMEEYQANWYLQNQLFTDMQACLDKGIEKIDSLLGEKVEAASSQSQAPSSSKLTRRSGTRNQSAAFLDGSASLYEAEENIPLKVKRSLVDSKFVLQELGSWCSNQVIQNYMRDLKLLESRRGFKDISMESLAMGIQCLETANYLFQEANKPVMECISDKCRQLVRILYEYHQMKTNSGTDLSKSGDISLSVAPEQNIPAVEGEGSDANRSSGMGATAKGITSEFGFEDCLPRNEFAIPEPDDDWIHTAGVGFPLESLASVQLLSDNAEKESPKRDGDEDESDDEEEGSSDGDSGGGFRALVFVQQRQFAYALSGLLNHLSRIWAPLEFLRVSHVTGHGASTLQSKEAQMTLSNQESVLANFRKGHLNVLVATRVIEEGMDVQECNIVIKMDPPEEFRSYVQSKGRARAANSHYVIMVPDNKKNDSLYKLDLYKEIEAALLTAIDDRVVDREDDQLESDQFQSSLRDQPIYMPFGKTGPRITLNSAMNVVSRYVSRLRQDSIMPLRARFDCETEEEGGFVGLLELPMPCPLLYTLQGPVASNKRLAKQLVALEACKELHKVGELDDNLLPMDRKLFDDLNDDDEDVDLSDLPGVIGSKKKRRSYNIGIAQRLSRGHQSPVLSDTNLLVYAIELDPTPENMFNLLDANFTHTNLCLALVLTEPINDIATDLARFPLFYEGGFSTANIRLRHQFVASSCGLSQLFECHKALMDSLITTAKGYRNDLVFDAEKAIFPWIVAIVDTESNYSIDWTMTQFICKHGSQHVNLLDVDKAYWPGSVIQPFHSPTDNGLYLLTEVTSDLNACSPFPSLRKAANFLEYYETNYKKVATRAPETQPLVLVKRLPSVPNLLCNNAAKSASTTSRIRRAHCLVQHFIPEFCDWIPLPASLWLHLSSLPFVLHRLNQLLLMQELHSQINRDLNLGMELPLPLELDESKVNLIMPDKDHFIEASSDVISSISLTNLLEATTLINSRDFLNLERLEMVGDSFLKYITSVYLHVSCSPMETEGRLSQRRQRVISNKNLFQIAGMRSLYFYLFPRPLQPRNHTLAPCFCVTNSTVNERVQQIISDKSIADSIEALIGCFLHYGNQAMALKLIFWLGLKLCPSDATNKLNPKDPLPSPPEPIVVPDLPEEELNMYLRKLCCGFDQLEEILQYQFKKREFLLQALTHASCLENRITCCYQRLEFLGDAVLDYLVTLHIFNQNKQLTPGKLTDLRSSLVNNNLFAALVVRWGLHKFLKHSDPVMFRLIGDFERKQVERKHKLRGIQFVSDIGEKVTLKVLGDVFESLAGAVFLDSGYCLSTTWRVFQRLMADPLTEFSRDVPINQIRLFYERFPQLTFSSPEVLEVTGLIRLSAVVNDEEFTVEERNTRLCKRALAKKVLARFST